MTSIDLKNIKTKSIRSVFLSIANKAKTTRAEIAKDTGLSLMTVGKIADILTRMGITKEEKESSGSVGRRASSIRISSLHYGIILDLSSQVYVCEIVDAGTRTMDQFSYAYNHEYYKEENTLLFLKNLTLYLSTRYDPEKCFGIGIIKDKFAPNSTSSDRTSDPNYAPRYQDDIQKSLADYSENIQWTSRVEAAAHHTAATAPEHDEKTTLYCYIEENVQSAMIVQGKTPMGKGGAIGNIEPWLAPITPIPDDFKTATQIASAIKQATELLNPHKLVIEADGHSAAFVAELQKQIFDIQLNCEQAIVRAQGVQSSRRGTALELRDRWINSLVSGEM